MTMHMFAMKILLTPFSGVEKDQPIKDAFNFYLSQLRIGLEQTFFVVMTTKWRMIWQTLQVRLKKLWKLFMCITDCIIAVLMRIVLTQSMQMKFKTMALSLFHLIYVKLALREILCFKLS